MLTFVPEVENAPHCVYADGNSGFSLRSSRCAHRRWYLCEATPGRSLGDEEDHVRAHGVKRRSAVAEGILAVDNGDHNNGEAESQQAPFVDAVGEIEFHERDLSSKKMSSDVEKVSVAEEFSVYDSERIENVKILLNSENFLSENDESLFTNVKRPVKLAQETMTPSNERLQAKSKNELFEIDETQFKNKKRYLFIDEEATQISSEREQAHYKKRSVPDDITDNKDYSTENEDYIAADVPVQHEAGQSEQGRLIHKDLR